MKNHLLIASALVTTLAGLAFSGAVMAQDAQPVVEQPAGDLPDVIVTATKRVTNLQSTPVAASVVNAQALGNRHVQSLLDLADGAVPSLRVATFEARQSALTVGIRGIVPFDANQTARDQGVGVYIDGIYMGRQQGLNAALFDVQRIEVLRGPQGTLFGRNTEGGALSIVTKEPTGIYGGRISGGFGNYGSYDMQSHIDLPKFLNFSVKVDVVKQHQDPTVKNTLTGQAGYNQYDRTGARISAKWTPNEQLSGLFTIDTSSDENTPNYSQLINYNPTNQPVATLADIAGNGGKLPSGKIAPLAPSIFVSGRTRMKQTDVGVVMQPSLDQTSGGSATFSYKIAPGLELKSITGVHRVAVDQYDNGSPHRTTFIPNTAFGRYSLSFMKQDQISQEFQLIGNTANIDYVAGLYYFKENVSEYASTPLTQTWNADGTGFSVNSETLVGTKTSTNMGWVDKSQMYIARDSHSTNTSTAAFGQATWTPASLDALHLTLGGRYTNDKRDGALTMINNVATPYVLHYDEGRFDPLAIAAYDVNADVYVYAKYASGYRAGGANDRSTDFKAFLPEVAKSLELGAKADLFDHKARLNVAVYQMDRTGTQLDDSNVDTNLFLPGTTTPNPNANKNVEDTYNAAGKSTIKGLEAELLLKPTSNLTLGLNYAYTDVTIPLAVNKSGVKTQYYAVFTPKNAASATIDYNRPFGGAGASFRFHLDGNYADPQYTFQNESVMSDRSLVFNGRIALADIPMEQSGTKLTLSIWSRNLTDTTYIYRRSAANAKTLGDYGNFNPPRTVGVEANVSF